MIVRRRRQPRNPEATSQWTVTGKDLDKKTGKQDAFQSSFRLLQDFDDKVAVACVTRPQFPRKKLTVRSFWETDELGL